MSKRILFFFGTRPEAIKLAPVIKLARETKMLDPVVCITGQHAGLIGQALDTFGITPDYDLGVMIPDQTLDSLTSRMLRKAEAILDLEKPEWIIVQGDASSAFVGALAGFYHHIKIAHIEAGLRTNKLTEPFPEEMNRRFIDHVSDVLFAPTEAAKWNLRRENIASEIIVTGNTGVDAVCLIDVKEELEQRKYILVEVHRRENFGPRLEEICAAIKELSKEILIKFVVHPNPHIKEPVQEMLGNESGIELLPPQSYPEMLHLLKNARLMMTDSGGLQEDAAELHTPAIILRELTERIENLSTSAFSAGCKKESILRVTRELLHNSSLYASAVSYPNPYGDGKASKRIIRYFEMF